MTNAVNFTLRVPWPTLDAAVQKITEAVGGTLHTRHPTEISSDLGRPLTLVKDERQRFEELLLRTVRAKNESSLDEVLSALEPLMMFEELITRLQHELQRMKRYAAITLSSRLDHVSQRLAESLKATKCKSACCNMDRTPMFCVSDFLVNTKQV